RSGLPIERSGVCTSMPPPSRPWRTFFAAGSQRYSAKAAATAKTSARVGDAAMALAAPAKQTRRGMSERNFIRELRGFLAKSFALGLEIFQANVFTCGNSAPCG